MGCPPRAKASTHKCNVCDASFARQEHLTRHIRIHTRERPYECKHCHKSFSRRDVLTRHISSHEDAAIPMTPVSERACKECATGRVRCSREQPCKRCSEKGLACEYPSPKKRRASVISRSDVNGHSVVLNDAANGNSRSQGSYLIHQEAAGVLERNMGQTPNENGYSNGTIANPSAGSYWTNTLGSADLHDSPENMYNFGQPPLGLSCVNWMSPDSQVAGDWDTQMADFSVNNAGLSVRNVGFPFFFSTHGPMNAPYGTWDSAPAEVPADLRPGRSHQNLAQSEAGVPPSPETVNTSHSASTEAIFYVDGTSARAPFGGRANPRGSISHTSGTSRTPAMSELLPPAAIEDMLEKVKIECQIQAAELGLESLPSHVDIELYLRQYFDKFHPLFPFLRKASFAAEASRLWILSLAVAAVGSRYHQDRRDHSGLLFLVLRSVLIRSLYGLHPADDDNVLYIPGDRFTSPAGYDIQFLQAGILNIIMMLHSGKKSLIDRALVERHYLVEACSRLGLLSTQARNSDFGENKPGEDAITVWLANEAQSRTGMMVWFLDTIVMYEFDEHPLIQLDDVKAPLPSREEVWENPSNEKFESRKASITLNEAIEMLYMEKRLPPHLSEFGTELLISAIYRRTKEVVIREQTQLNQWTPTATIQPRPKPPVVSESWPPATPRISKWRNGACDCLDILHWSANGKVARCSGFEHHTVLYLHLSRLLILTPVAHIQVFANDSSNAQPGKPSNDRYITARSHILQWAVRDQFKARLSVIHCGALFWHVRRYSRDSVIEPFAIYIATLVLWAYCVSAQFVGEAAVETYASGEAAPTAEAVEATDITAHEFSFVHLDRPLDDELVQLFVRQGYKMSGYIAKVGNINDSGASSKILREGIRLLARDTPPVDSGKANSGGPTREAPPFTWGIEASFIKLLEKLVSATD